MLFLAKWHLVVADCAVVCTRVVQRVLAQSGFSLLFFFHAKKVHVSQAARLVAAVELFRDQVVSRFGLSRNSDDMILFKTHVSIGPKKRVLETDQRTDSGTTRWRGNKVKQQQDGDIRAKRAGRRDVNDVKLRSPVVLHYSISTSRRTTAARTCRSSGLAVETGASTKASAALPTTNRSPAPSHGRAKPSRCRHPRQTGRKPDRGRELRSMGKQGAIVIWAMPRWRGNGWFF